MLDNLIIRAEKVKQLTKEVQDLKHLKEMLLIIDNKIKTAAENGSYYLWVNNNSFKNVDNLNKVKDVLKELDYKIVEDVPGSITEGMGFRIHWN